MPETMLTDQLRMFIVSVNGHVDQLSINSFIENLPALDSRYLRTVYEQTMPDVKLKETFECTACDFDQELEVPFTTDFFWPKR